MRYHGNNISLDEPTDERGERISRKHNALANTVGWQFYKNIMIMTLFPLFPWQLHEMWNIPVTG